MRARAAGVWGASVFVCAVSVSACNTPPALTGAPVVIASGASPATAAPAPSAAAVAPSKKVGAPRWSRLTGAAVARAISFPQPFESTSTDAPDGTLRGVGQQHVERRVTLTAPSGGYPEIDIDLVHGEETWRQAIDQLAEAPTGSPFATRVALALGRRGTVIAVPGMAGVGFMAVIPTADAERFITVSNTKRIPSTKDIRDPDARAFWEHEERDAASAPLGWMTTLAAAVDAILFGG